MAGAPAAEEPQSRKPKRLDEIPPPATDDEYTLKYATKESLHFEEMARRFPGTCGELKRQLKNTPLVRSDVQNPLKGNLSTRSVQGKTLPQWQYDISSSARVWYCTDTETKTVWLTLASSGHPKATETKAKRAPRGR